MLFSFNEQATTEIYKYGKTLSRHDAIPSEVIGHEAGAGAAARQRRQDDAVRRLDSAQRDRIEKRYGHKSSSFHFLRDVPAGRRYGPVELWTRGARKIGRAHV